MSRRWLAVSIVFGLGLGGCKPNKRDPAGVYRWDVEKTTRQDADGRCVPTDLADGRKGSWCFGQTPLKIGTRNATIDLYFDGEAPTARLIEIQLNIRGCDEPVLEGWLRQRLGPPQTTAGRRTTWANREMVTFADMPSEPAQCLVRMLPLREAGLIARLRDGTPAGPLRPLLRPLLRSNRGVPVGAELGDQRLRGAGLEHHHADLAVVGQ